MSTKIIDEPSLRQKKYVFEDRLHAAQMLAEKLGEWSRGKAIIMAIPSGGVPVGVVLAKKLGLPLELAIVRKVQIPWEPEAGFGAVTWDGLTIFNEPLRAELGLDEEKVEACVVKARKEIQKRIEKFRGKKEFPDLKGKTIIVVDDGLASGYTMIAALLSLKRHMPDKVVVAVPTASKTALDLVSGHADQIICLNIRDEILYAVAGAYQEWHDLSDVEVLRFLQEAVQT